MKKKILYVLRYKTEVGKEADAVMVFNSEDEYAAVMSEYEEKMGEDHYYLDVIDAPSTRKAKLEYLLEQSGYYEELEDKKAEQKLKRQMLKEEKMRAEKEKKDLEIYKKKAKKNPKRIEAEKRKAELLKRHG